MNANLMLRAACVAAAVAAGFVGSGAQAQGFQPPGHAKMMQNADESAQAGADFPFQIVPAKAGIAAPGAGAAVESYGGQPATQSQEGRRALSPCGDLRTCGGATGH
ncbi:hypothetical protein [Paraburkholderia phosphatilytica]|uniref:hypothetical protein n=1 Tax=Paraburkholderia phosphatilytica TaxID=2282883 RepID=UPI000F5EC6C2|nr:hypothetical protein [Paraburkholderia phosphatilytica]